MMDRLLEAIERGTRCAIPPDDEWWWVVDADGAALVELQLLGLILAFWGIAWLVHRVPLSMEALGAGGRRWLAPEGPAASSARKMDPRLQFARWLYESGRLRG